MNVTYIKLKTVFFRLLFFLTEANFMSQEVTQKKIQIK